MIEGVGHRLVEELAAIAQPPGSMPRTLAEGWPPDAVSYKIPARVLRRRLGGVRERTPEWTKTVKLARTRGRQQR